jgi:hypothetical protein
LGAWATWRIPQQIKSVSNWKKNVYRSAYDDRAKKAQNAKPDAVVVL